jgi:drug/metabolite transporter (DMT)-like permease
MHSNWIKWLLFLLLCFIWGSSFILMKASRDGLSGMQIGALRIFSAGIVCLPFVFHHFKKIPSRKTGLLFLTGTLGNFLPALLFALAITRIDSSLAGVLNSLTPLCVVCIGVWVYRDKISRQKIVGVLIGFAGLCLLSFGQSQVSDWGNLGYASLVLLATICYGFNVNLVSHQLSGLPPIAVATTSLILMIIPSGIVLAYTGFFSLPFGDSIVQWAVLNSVILGIVSSAIATALFYLLVQRASGLFASLVTYGIPFVALSWGFLDGEKITLLTVLSLGVILGGVYLAQRSRGKL